MSKSETPPNTGLLPLRKLAPMLEDTSSGVYRSLDELYPSSTNLQEKARLCLDALNVFSEHFGSDSDVFVVRAPGRINLLGMHVDHRGGYTNPIAIHEIFFVVSPRDDDIIELRNAEPDRFGPASFKITDELPQGKIDDWDTWTHHECERRAKAGTSGDWSNYVKSAILYIQHLHTKADGSFDPPLRGMNIAVRGDVPRAAGLSSSSAIVVGAMEACLAVNGLAMPELEMIEACRLAEWFVGTRGGGGDHAAIKCGKKDHLLRVGSWPFSVSHAPFPAGYSIVLADSMVKAAKQEGARDRYNAPLASYAIGLLMLRKNFPQYREKLQHIRDASPDRLGVSESEIYRMIRSLPQRCSREETLAELPEEKELLQRIFRSHAAPAGGYRIRQVCVYGICECLRSELAAGLLQQGRVEDFGEMINLSHDGDRVTHLDNGKRVPQDNSMPDDTLDKLIADAESDDPQAVERARLWRQPGGYDVSCPEQDALVDIARTVPGVIGAGLVGAGLGGSIIALVRSEQAQDVVRAFDEQYYQPRGLPLASQIVVPVGGAGLIHL